VNLGIFLVFFFESLLCFRDVRGDERDFGMQRVFV
jgi:hypothetical protein